MSGACPSLGFILAVRWPAETSAEARWQFEWALRQRAESLGLTCSGGGDVPRYVLASESSQVTERDRDAIAAWTAGRLDEGMWEVSAVFDLDEMR